MSQHRQFSIPKSVIKILKNIFFSNLMNRPQIKYLHFKDFVILISLNLKTN